MAEPQFETPPYDWAAAEADMLNPAFVSQTQPETLRKKAMFTNLYLALNLLRLSEGEVPKGSGLYFDWQFNDGDKRKMLIIDERGRGIDTPVKIIVNDYTLKRPELREHIILSSSYDVYETGLKIAVQECEIAEPSGTQKWELGKNGCLLWRKEPDTLLTVFHGTDFGSRPSVDAPIHEASKAYQAIESLTAILHSASRIIVEKIKYNAQLHGAA